MKEVIDIMMMLYDKEYIMWAHDEEIKREGIQQGMQQGELKKARATAQNMETMGFSMEKIAQALATSVETVQQWLGERKLHKKM